MHPVLSFLVRSAFLSLLLLHFQPADVPAAETMMTIGSGSITGVYYGAGSAVAKMHNKVRKESGLWLISQASEGSLANIGDVLEDKVQFGISQSNFLYHAWNGHELFNNVPQKQLRAVLGLYTEDVTLVAATDAGITTPNDLRGKRVNIGEPGSSDHETSSHILKALGVDLKEDLEVSEAPSYEAPEKIQSDDIDAYFYTVGHPNLSIIEASAGERKVRIVPFDQEFVDFARSTKSYLSGSEIDVNFYEKLENDAPVPTIGLKAILFTREGINENVVYRMVKQVMENLELFRRQHPAFAKLTAETMSQGTIVPLHPGSERYFKETGILP